MSNSLFPCEPFDHRKLNGRSGTRRNISFAFTSEQALSEERPEQGEIASSDWIVNLLTIF
jgi:hypothetical protein